MSRKPQETDTNTKAKKYNVNKLFILRSFKPFFHIKMTVKFKARFGMLHNGFLEYVKILVMFRKRAKTVKNLRLC